MKAINAKDKTIEKIFKALDLAREKKIDRASLKHIYYDVDNKKLVATNGKAMLIYKIEDEELLEAFGNESGYYVLEGKVLIETDHEGSPFPAYQRVIPNMGNMECSLLSECSVKDTSAKVKPYQTFAAAMLISGMKLNMDYAGIIAGLDLDTCYYWKEKTFAPLVLAGKNLQFIIMPVA